MNLLEELLEHPIVLGGREDERHCEAHVLALAENFRRPFEWRIRRWPDLADGLSVAMSLGRKGDRPR